MSRGPTDFEPTPPVTLEPIVRPKVSSSLLSTLAPEPIPVSEELEEETAATGSPGTALGGTVVPAPFVATGSTISCEIFTTGRSSGEIQNPFSGEPAGGTPPEAPDLFEYSSVIDAQESYIENLSTCQESKDQMTSFVRENSSIQWFPVRYGDKYIMVSRDFVKDSSGNYIRVSTGSAVSIANSYGARPPNSSNEAKAIFNSALIFKLQPFGSGPEGQANDIATSAGKSEKQASDAAFRQNTALNNSTTLVDGHLKTVYTTGIYGGSKTGGSIVYQGGSNPHGAGYADYSQGLRLVSRQTFAVC